MRICLLSRYFDFRNAGLGRVGMEIAAELVARGHSVYTISTNGNSLYSYFLYTATLWSRLPKADVYHAITPMEAIWLPKDRSIVTYHDLFQVTDPTKLGSGMGYNKFNNLAGRAYFRFAVERAKRCARVVSVSYQTQKDLQTYLKVQSKVIVSGISSSLKPLRPSSDTILTVGYLGQLDRRKRVDILITSFKRYAPPELKLRIAGTGVDEAKLRALAAEDSRIEFLGKIPNRELVDFYNSLDVFIFPTWLEGYGLPIVEATACGLPVVVLQDAKIPAEVKSRCIITDSLDYLFNTPRYLKGRCAYSPENLEWAQAHSWKKAVDEYEKLYKEIA